ncbi:hypothetical protein SmJEL517_g01596 [Synchytrium microbalum]|uniref:Rho-GAP domain-containing protein n=1 Tax=Synchytrium microbalum TaxID=1806994 RepID=A0A507CEW0_9FUNG|nr:uncharacterized protein SmJEL517_g01596 [Synchytrium microbalum]TPX36115.1 hypothetical protein SmJEL517_g01596 [Synchytrium microbalum]
MSPGPVAGTRIAEPEVAYEKASAAGEDAINWLQEYLLERSEIEKDYSDRLRKLQMRFSSRAFPAPRDGSLVKAWDSSLKLAKELVEHHRALSERLGTLGANVAESWGKQYGLTRYLLTNEIKASNIAYKEKTKVMRTFGDRYNAAGAALETLKKEDPRNSSKLSKAESDLRSADQAYRESVVQLKKEKATYDAAGDAFESKWRTLEETRITNTADTFTELSTAEQTLTANRQVLVTSLITSISSIDKSRDIQLFTSTFRWPTLSPMSISGPGPRDPSTNAVTSVQLKDLFFNIRLEIAYDKTIPIVLSRCIEAVEARGLDREGIYRVPGKAVDRESLTSAFERDEAAVDLTETGSYDVNAIASLVKYYIRQLPDPLFPIDSKDVAEYPKIPEGQKPFWLIQKLAPGPPTHKTRAHQHTMRVLVEHLAKIVDHSETNKMTLINIATVFAPVIFNMGGDEDTSNSGSRTNLSNIFNRKDANGLEDKAKEIDTLVLITEDTIRLRNLVFPKLEGAYPSQSTSSASTLPRTSLTNASMASSIPMSSSPPSSLSTLASAAQQQQQHQTTNTTGNFSDNLPTRNDSLPGQPVPPRGVSRAPGPAVKPGSISTASTGGNSNSDPASPVA